MGLHKGRLPQLIVQRIIEQKEQLTTSELARELEVSKEKISVALCNLRKKGILIHPVGGESNPNSGTFSEGVLVDASSDKSYFIEVNERYKSQLDPRLATQLLSIEKAWTKFPELRENIENSLEQLQIRLLEGKHNLRKITQGNGN